MHERLLPRTIRVLPKGFVVGSILALSGCATRSLPPNVLSGDRAEAMPDLRAMNAVSFAQAQVGKRYCWGGEGPNCFDCSGLAQAAWSHAGARIPRTSEDISRSLPEVPASDVRAGDILWWPGHVGIYIGHGQMVDARNAARGVVQGPVRDPYRAFRPEG